MYLRLYRSLMSMTFTSDASARFWNAWRKMLRCLLVKPVSNGSVDGIAPFRPPAGSNGRVKQAGLSAAFPPLGVHAPEAPVSAVFAVHPFAKGTMGLVMPSEVE